MQRAPHQRTVAALRTLGKVDTGPRSPPLHSAGLLAGRWSGRRAQPVSTLAQGAGLTPVGQEAHLPQTLEAGGHDMEQKTPDELMGLQHHGLPAMVLAPLVICAASATVANIQEAMMRNRDAVDRASQGLQHLGWPRARALGVAPPYASS